MDEKSGEYLGAEKPSWVQRLSRKERALYEQNRRAALATDETILFDGLRAVDDLSCASDDVLQRVAKRVAIIIHDEYDKGIQVGMDQGEQATRRRLDEYRQREVRRLGGWG